MTLEELSMSIVPGRAAHDNDRIVSDVDRLAARIALLATLNDVPEQPSINRIPKEADIGPSTKGWAFSLRHETRIVQELAFICAYSSEPLHVMAVCVEQNISKQSLCIQIASNSGKHDRFLEKFRKATLVLQEEARDVNRSNNSIKLLEAIVLINRSRLLSRLRSRHSTCHLARQKPALLDRLTIVEQILERSHSDGAGKQEVICQIKKVKQSCQLIENMTKKIARSSAVDSKLLVVVRECHTALTHYKLAFQKLPVVPPKWDKEATVHLLDRLQKVSHYVVVSDNLLRAARRYKLFSNIVVQFVNQQQCGAKLSQPAMLDLDGTLKVCCINEMSITAAKPLQKTLSNMKNKLKIAVSGKSRVHAEIQLAIHNELGKPNLRPRAIASSKEACYLCNLFFKLYGGYHIPSSHGRVYEAWRWPSGSLKFNPPNKSDERKETLLTAFTEAVNQQISRCLKDTSSKKRAHPVESSINLLGIITPSVLSVPAAEVHVGPQNAALTANKIDSAISFGKGALSSQTTDKPQDESHIRIADQPAEAIANGKYGKHPSKPNSDSVVGSLDDQPIASKVEGSDESVAVHLRQHGDKAIFEFPASLLMQRIHVPGLNLELEWNKYVGEEDDVENKTSMLKKVKNHKIEVFLISYDTLSDRDIAAKVIDVGSNDWLERRMPDGILFSTDGLLLRCKDVVVRLRAIS